MSETSDLWVDKHQPQKISDLILNEETKKLFQDMVNSGKINNMTLYGTSGIGKTTLAKILCRELNAIELFIPCGTEGSIDVVRTKINTFCESMAPEGTLKIVIMDEFDSASGAISTNGSDDGKASNNTMKSMRNVIEEHQDDCRFILTCNHVNKIIPPILSRCPPINITFTAKDVVGRIKTILDAENTTYTRDNLVDFYKRYILTYFPDIRKIIATLQNLCYSGKLLVPSNEAAETVTQIENLANDIIEKCKTEKVNVVRKFVIDNKSVFNEEYSKLAGVILNKSSTSLSAIKLKSMIEYIYRMDRVIDPEIQFFGFLLELMTT